MKFLLGATVDSCRWSKDEGIPKAIYLYVVKEKFEKFTKSWKIWTNKKLTLNKYYEFEGTVTEKPNEKRKDADGKAIYESNFNVYKVIDIDIRQNEDEIPI